MDLLNKVERYIRIHRLLQKGDRVIVAVSGGADSIALLHLIVSLRSSWQLHIGMAHLEHGLRGQESVQDAEFVRQQAEALDVPFFIQHRNVQAFADEQGLNLEEAGRWARQQFLADIAKEHKADRIALGHHRNDQAETVLHHLLRGSGLRGLGGMQPCRSHLWIRPLLEVTREEILAFLQKSGLTYRIDASNQDVRLTRNRIRHELLPYLARSFNPQIVRLLEQISQLARDDEDYLWKQTRQAAQTIVRPRQDGFSWSADALRQQYPAIRSRIILEALESLSQRQEEITQLHVKQVSELLEEGKSGKKVLLPGGLEAQRQFRELILTKRHSGQDSTWCLELNIPGEVASPDGLWCMEALPATVEDVVESCSKKTVSVLLPMSIGALQLSIWQPGDVYCIRHRRTVKRLWNDYKVPLEIRRLLPLVRQGSRVVWIPGFPPAGSSTTTAEGGRDCFVRLTFQPHPGSSLAAWLFRSKT